MMQKSVLDKDFDQNRSHVHQGCDLLDGEENQRNTRKQAPLIEIVKRP